jgi:HAD superfamily hydrolase (TIGR01509 family)
MKTYLFDFDGTLVDSMPTYGALMIRILNEAGIKYPDNIIKIITPLGFIGTAEYFIGMGMKEERDEIVARMRAYATDAYTNDVPAKEFVIETVKMLKARGDSLNVLTASPHIVTDACLRHNGVQGTFHWFDKVWSVEDFGLSKSDPQIFAKVAETIGCEVGEVHYFDDSLIALRNAKEAGYMTYGVYDAQTPDEVETMKELCDTVVMSFEEM